jgi:hypothetical protein
VSENGNDERLPERLKDPEPISIGIAIFGACVGAAGLIRQYREHARQARERRRRLLRHLNEVDKGLNGLCESYFELLSVYKQQEIMDAELLPGEVSIRGDEELVEQVRRLRDRIHESGKEVEDALDDLSEYVDDHMSHRAREYSAQLLDRYKRAKDSDNVRPFMISIGYLLISISDFHYEMCGYYDFYPYFSNRSDRLREIVESLEGHYEIELLPHS